MSRQVRQTWVGLGLAGCLVACVAAGCGPGGAEPLHPVSGDVRLDGKPLVVGSVTLYADAARGNPTQEVPVGEIKDGRYEVYTRGRRGAPPGAYRVVVVSNNFSGGKAPPPTGGTFEQPKSFIHDKYGHPARTPLAVEVVAKPAAGAYDLQVTR